MANTTVRRDLVPPTHARVVAVSTAAVLHLDATNGGVAPPGVNHLPCGVIFHQAANFVWKDSTGATVTTVVPATACGIFCPIGPMELDATNGVACTVFWNPEP